MERETADSSHYQGHVTVSDDAVNVVWSTATKNTAALKFVGFATPCTKSTHIEGAVDVLVEGLERTFWFFEL